MRSARDHAPRAGMSAQEWPDAFCDLCSEPIPQEDASAEAFEATGFFVCTDCIEEMLP